MISLATQAERILQKHQPGMDDEFAKYMEKIKMTRNDILKMYDRGDCQTPSETEVTHWREKIESLRTK